MSLRKYEVGSKQYEFYKKMYENQTLNFVLRMKQKYSELNNIKIPINKAFEFL